MAVPSSDPSIKAIILKIDGEHNDYIIEDLDDNTILVKETKIPELKRRLERVSLYIYIYIYLPFSKAAAGSSDLC